MFHVSTIRTRLFPHFYIRLARPTSAWHFSACIIDFDQHVKLVRCSWGCWGSWETPLLPSLQPFLFMMLCTDIFCCLPLTNKKDLIPWRKKWCVHNWNSGNVAGFNLLSTAYIYKPSLRMTHLWQCLQYSAPVPCVLQSSLLWKKIVNSHTKWGKDRL